MSESPLFVQARSWRDHDPDPTTRRELSALLDAGAGAELAERFAASLEFGTAGLRGILGGGTNRMNRAVVRRTTAGLARYLLDVVPEVRERGVVIGRDGRRLSPELAEDTAGVLMAHGIPALYFEAMVPTPVTAFATLHLGAAAAVMVTASHNPPEYNGYKVYWGNGAQIIPPHDQGIAAAIDAVGPADEVPLLTVDEGRRRGLYRSLGSAVERAYLDAILALRLHRRDADRLTIVYTAMHGVGGRFVEAALGEAGFSRLHLVAEQQQPDGAFPTVRFPNPEEPGAMDRATALAEGEGADLVLANDPDADRLAVMARDGDGRLRHLSGNEVGVLLGHYVLTQSPGIERPLLITSIVSSPQLGEICRELGALYDETLTGFKWIGNRALERQAGEGANFLFGYEEALGYTVGTVARDKDGVGAALCFADLAAWCLARGTTVPGYLEEIQRRHGLFVAAQRSFTFPGSEGQAAMRGIMEGFRAAPPSRFGDHLVEETLDYQRGEATCGGEVRRLSLPLANVIAYRLAGGSRITLRPSGTEPKIKYYFELRGDFAAGESLAEARRRAESRLGALADSFLAAARERGQQ